MCIGTYDRQCNIHLAGRVGVAGGGPLFRTTSARFPSEHGGRGARGRAPPDLSCAASRRENDPETTPSGKIHVQRPSTVSRRTMSAKRPEDAQSQSKAAVVDSGSRRIWPGRHGQNAMPRHGASKACRISHKYPEKIGFHQAGL
jgi:hypothetical protein